jgi:hypothetical protein
LGNVSEHGETMVYRWAHSDDPDRPSELGQLAETEKSDFPNAAIYTPGAQWVYDSTPWIAGRPDEDLGWVTAKLSAAVDAWQALASDG